MEEEREVKKREEGEWMMEVSEVPDKVGGIGKLRHEIRHRLINIERALRVEKEEQEDSGKKEHNLHASSIRRFLFALYSGSVADLLNTSGDTQEEEWDWLVSCGRGFGESGMVVENLDIAEVHLMVLELGEVMGLPVEAEEVLRKRKEREWRKSEREEWEKERLQKRSHMTKIKLGISGPSQGSVSELVDSKEEIRPFIDYTEEERKEELRNGNLHTGGGPQYEDRGVAKEGETTREEGDRGESGNVGERKDGGLPRED
jgi:hypothetical protein